MSYDSDVVSATSGRGEADWDKLIKLCDRIRESYGTSAMASALTSVMKRVRHPDSAVQVQALTLLEACVSNCGKEFQRELTKQFFQSQVKEILSSRQTDSQVSNKLKSLLSGWASEFKSDSQMSGLVRFVEQLGKDGVSLATSTAQQTTTQPRTQEESDLERAIRMSLQEAQNQPAPSSYPTLSTAQPQRKTSASKKKVRAIYDFEAAEDNELTFKAGEIITVLDDSDESWWKGETQLGAGLFPANFVTTDLRADPEPVRVEKKATSSAVSTATGVAKVTVNESQVDLLLDMLKTADITSTDPEENKTFVHLEEECKQMKLLVEKNITALQKQTDEMEEVSDKLQEAFTMYRKLLQDGPRLSNMPLPSHSTTTTEVVHGGTQPPPYQPYNAPPPSQYYHTQPEVPPQHGYATASYAPSSYEKQQPLSMPEYVHPAQQQSLAPPAATQQPSSLPSQPPSQYQPSYNQILPQSHQVQYTQYLPHPSNDPAASSLWSSPQLGPPTASQPTAAPGGRYSPITHHHQYTQPLSLQQPLL